MPQNAAKVNPQQAGRPDHKHYMEKS